MTPPDLRAQDTLARVALEALPLALALVDAGGRIALASRAWRERVGSEAGEGYLSSCGLLVPDLVPLARALEAALGGTALELEVPLLEAPGRWRVRLAPLATPDGPAALATHEEVAGPPGVARDPTLEAWGRHAGGVAHDVNNVLVGVLGYAELAASRLPDEHPAREAVGEVLRASARAAGLLRQLLGGARQPRTCPVDLAALVGDVAPLLRLLAGERVALVTRLEGEARVLADPSRLEQVVLNLALNGRDAMPDGGRLEISVGPGELDGLAGRQVVLTVRDTGVGIAPEALPRVFEPFFTTKGGVGLGLATVREIVEECGGRLRVESAPGQGATFAVYLPPAPP